MESLPHSICPASLLDETHNTTVPVPGYQDYKQRGEDAKHGVVLRAHKVGQRGWPLCLEGTGKCSGQDLGKDTFVLSAVFRFTCHSSEKAQDLVLPPSGCGGVLGGFKQHVRQAALQGSS